MLSLQASSLPTLSSLSLLPSPSRSKTVKRSQFSHHAPKLLFQWYSKGEASRSRPGRFMPCAATGFGGKGSSKKKEPDLWVPVCPCGGGDVAAPYEDCCARFHGGVVEPNAVTLMKARYSAFALSKVSYLVRTTHPQNADMAEGEQKLRDDISATCKCSAFKRLKVVSSQQTQGDGPEVALVSFRAKYAYKNDKVERVLSETGRFVKEGKRWLYLEQIVEDAKSKRDWDLGAVLYKAPSEEEKIGNKMVTKGKPGVTFRNP